MVVLKTSLASMLTWALRLSARLMVLSFCRSVQKVLGCL